MPAQPVFGITFTRQDGEARPVTPGDLSVIGLIGTAPAADAGAFPLNVAVALDTNDAAKVALLGATGTLPDAVRGVDDQLAAIGAAARLVIVRVEQGEDGDDAADYAETVANLVGDANARTGVHAFRNAAATAKRIPRLIGAPGFTHTPAAGGGANPVLAALPAVLGQLSAHAVADVGGADLAAALALREDFPVSERIIPVYGDVRVQEGEAVVTRPFAPRVLGAIAAVDFENGGVPSKTAANRPIYGIVGPARNVAFSFTDGGTEGQELLDANIGVLAAGELGVEASVGDAGLVYIGTDNAGADELWRFYSVTRMRDYLHLQALKAVRTYLGRFNLTGQTVQAVLNTLRFECRDLAADGHLLGYQVDFSSTGNSVEQLRAGRITVSFRAEEPPVLRRVDILSGRYRPAVDALLADLQGQLTGNGLAA